MSDLNVTAAGNATRDPELRYTQGGKAVCSFAIACNKRVKNADGDWEDGPTTFVNVTAWDQLAENVAATVTKGARVIVTGELFLDQFERDDGTKGQSLKLTATDVGVSLRWVTGTLERTNRSADSQRFPTAPGGRASSRPVAHNEEPF